MNVVVLIAPTYIWLAEEVGFEPTEAFTSHAFQACRFGRSRTLPSGCIATTTGGQANWLVRSSHQFPRVSVGGEVAVGSCATIARKPGQVLTEAASTRERLCAAGRLAVTSLPMAPGFVLSRAKSSGWSNCGQSWRARRAPRGLSSLIVLQQLPGPLWGLAIPSHQRVRSQRRHQHR